MAINIVDNKSGIGRKCFFDFEENKSAENNSPACANKFGTFIYTHKSSQPIGNGLKALIRFTDNRNVDTINKNSVDNNLRPYHSFDEIDILYFLEDIFNLKKKRIMLVRKMYLLKNSGMVKILVMLN